MNELRGSDASRKCWRADRGRINGSSLFLAYLRITDMSKLKVPQLLQQAEQHEKTGNLAAMEREPFHFGGGLHAFQKTRETNGRAGAVGNELRDVWHLVDGG